MRVAINKKEGVLLAQIPIFLFYMLPFYIFVAGNPYLLQLLFAFYIAILLLFAVNIRSGTQAELIFFDKATGVFWEDGLCLLPTALPILHHIGIHLFWWIKRQNRDPQAYSDTKPEITHHYDVKKMRYTAVVKTSMLTANVNRHLENSVEFFTEYKRGDPELLFQRVALRLMIIIIVIGAITNHISPNNTTRGGNTNPNQSNGNTVMVTIQLMKRDQPSYPTKDLFVPQSGNAWQYETMNGRKYFYYNDGGAKTSVMTVKDSRCAAIPASRKIFFRGNFVPTYAISMQEKITYTVTAASMPLYKKIGRLILEGEPLDSSSYIVERSWETMYNEWNSAVITSRGFLAEARSLDEVRDGVFGGLVCF